MNLKFFWENFSKILRTIFVCVMIGEFLCIILFLQYLQMLCEYIEEKYLKRFALVKYFVFIRCEAVKVQGVKKNSLYSASYLPPPSETSETSAPHQTGTPSSPPALIGAELWLVAK